MTGIKFFHPKVHPGYSSNYSAERNVAIGRDFTINGKPQSYLEVGRQLGDVSNVWKGRSEDKKKYSEYERHKAKEISDSFKRAETLAYKMHSEGYR